MKSFGLLFLLFSFVALLTAGCTGAQNNGSPNSTSDFENAAAREESQSTAVAIPPASEIIDSQNNVWTVSNGVILKNGRDAGYSAHVILLIYYKGIISQENASHGWWSWNGDGWTALSGDPRETLPSPTPTPVADPTPKPTASPTPVPTASPVSGNSVFNCSSFASSGDCGVGRSSFYLLGGGSPSLSGSRVLLTNPARSDHVANDMIYQTRVNVQAFTASFTFVPNEWNLSFVLENTNNVPGFDEDIFQAGAGCEAGFYQAFGHPYNPPNNIFALEFDMRSSLENENPYNILPPDSTVQIYKQDESPCNPNDTQPNYVYKPKVSTSPVSFIKPWVSATNASLDYNPTGDTYSAKITYDGSNLTLELYDVTKNGSCPGRGCFSYTWTSVDIPSWVNGSTAWVALTTGTSQPSSGSSITTDVGPTYNPLYIDSFSYSAGKP